MQDEKKQLDLYVETRQHKKMRSAQVQSGPPCRPYIGRLRTSSQAFPLARRLQAICWQSAKKRHHAGTKQRKACTRQRTAAKNDEPTGPMPIGVSPPRRTRWVENRLTGSTSRPLKKSVCFHCADWMLVHGHYAPASLVRFYLRRVGNLGHCIDIVS